MSSLKKAICSGLIFALLNLAGSQAEAAPLYSSDCGGCGYEECRRTPALTPAIVLGAVALAAVLAVALQQAHGGHAHIH